MSNTAQSESDSQNKAKRRKHFKELRVAIANGDDAAVTHLLVRSPVCLAEECEDPESLLRTKLYSVPGLPERISIRLRLEAQREPYPTVAQLARLPRLRQAFS